MTTPASLVSIVVVTHDNWPDLELAIESALGQSWPNIDVVVVDNDSSDATQQEVLRLYGDRLRYVRQANTLDGGGYNRGIAETSGEFVQLLDGDDLLAPNKIARQMAVFAERPDADIVYGEARQFQGQAGKPEWSDWETTHQEDMLLAIIDPRFEGAGLLTHSVLFRRRTLDLVGPWDENFVGADLDYWLRAAWAGSNFVFSPGAWCFHRRRSAQMSADMPVMYDRTLRTFEKALTYVSREPYRSAIRRRLSGLHYGNALTNLSLSPDAARRELEAARALDAGRISAVPYLAGYAAISLPGVRRLMKSSALKTPRRVLARAIGVIDT
jgi:glycosyltransferase involved in cell wall biosynthesis